MLDENDFKILSEYDFTTHFKEISFKGSLYKISFSIYSDCLDISDILYICDVKDKNGLKDYENIHLKQYDVEYQQISTLLKKHYFGGDVNVR